MSMSAYGAAEDVAGLVIVKNARDNYSENSDIARSVIALTSLGVDAARVYGGEYGYKYLQTESQLIDGQMNKRNCTCAIPLCPLNR